MKSDIVFSKQSDDWRTPPDLFATLHAEFTFTWDAAATKADRLTHLWLGPGSRHGADALTVDWASLQPRGAMWLNPPYSRVGEFVEKAAWERRQGVTTVMLIPSRTDTRWWHNYIWDRTVHRWDDGIEGRFLKGRVRFVDPTGAATNSAPFPSAIIVFHGDPT